MTDAAESAASPEGSQSTEVYARRARIGRIALMIRTGLAQLIILSGTVVLARHLRPAEFGAFAMVQFVLGVLTLAGDAGLGGALMQKSGVPTQRELASVFWAQLGLALAVLVVAWVLAEAVPIVWPGLPAGSHWILRALALNFVFTSARVVPTLLLERELYFVRVSILDTVNSVTFYLVASIAALLDAGVWALVVGTLTQGALGLCTALVLRPWRPTFEVDVASLRRLLGFGVPYQARNGLLLLTRSSVAVVGGTMLGSHTVGLINWALENAFFPMTFVEILARVSFPFYSRLQNTPDAFAAELQRSIRLAATITFFLCGMFVGLGPELTAIIFSAQWLDAVPMLMALSISLTIGMLVYLLAPAFDAIGKPRLVLIVAAVIAVAVWIGTPLGTHLGGGLGFSIAYGVALVLGGLCVVAMARRHLPPVEIAAPLLAPLIATVAIALLGRFVLAPHTVGPLSLAASVFAQIVSFLAIIAVLDRRTWAVLLATVVPRRPAPAGSAAP